MPASLASAERFWWRAISTATDTTVSRLFPIVQSFTMTASTATALVHGPEQMAEMSMRELTNTKQGVGPGTRRVPIEIHSMGQSRLSNGDLILGRKLSMKIDGRSLNAVERSGVNIYVLPADQIVPRAYETFYFFDRTVDVERFLTFVRDSIQPGERVMLGVSDVSLDSVAFGEPARRKQIHDAFRSIGSTLVDSIGFEDSYALFGGKGIDPADVREKLVNAAPLRALGVDPPYWADLYDTLIEVPRAGTLTTVQIGPAKRWKSVTIDAVGTGALTTRIVGVRADGISDTLTSTTQRGAIDLSSVDARRYPRLIVSDAFSNDTTLRVRSLAFEYTPSPELAIVPGTLRADHDSTLQGDPIRVIARVINLSRVEGADSVWVRVRPIGEDRIDPSDSTLVDRLAPLEARDVPVGINTDRLRGEHTVAYTVNPQDIPAEPYRSNNERTRTIRVGSDSVAPSIEVYVDGHRLMPNDYVSPYARFEIRLVDNSSLRLDSTSLRAFVDAERYQAGDADVSFDPTTGENRVRGVLRFVPRDTLASGSHTLLVFARDASDNGDSTGLIYFNVEHALKLVHVVNVPNPFVDRTFFTFMIGGASPPHDGEIAVFTASGRRVKTIHLNAADLHLGFNTVPWDGRDEDGDRMANGVYLYRVTVDDGTDRQLEIEKLVIMR
jgi:hypothetical protein